MLFGITGAFAQQIGIRSYKNGKSARIYEAKLHRIIDNPASRIYVFVVSDTQNDDNLLRHHRKKACSRVKYSCIKIRRRY